MIGRVPRHRHSSDEVQPFALHVFIPGALASGFLVSLAVLAADVVGRIRGDRGVRRKVEMTGAALAAEVRDGYGAAQHDSTGLRHRYVYGLVGSTALAIAVAVIPGATWNFLNRGGYLSNIGWIWAICLVTVAGVVVLAVQTLRLVPEWIPLAVGMVGSGVILRFVVGPERGVVRSVAIVAAALATSVALAWTWHLRTRSSVVRVPGSIRPLLTSTPLGRLPGDAVFETHHSNLPRPSIAIGRNGILVLMGSLITLSVAAKVAPDQLDWVDLRLADLVDSQRYLGFFRGVSQLGSTELTVALAGVASVAVWRRCRPLAILYPMAVVGGLVVNVVMKEMIGRARPPDAFTHTSLASFPSGHTIQATIALGMLPPVIYALTNRRSAAIATAVLAAAGTATVGLSRVVLGAHWASDIVGGVLVGMVVLLVAEAALDRLPDRWLSHCTTCPIHLAWGLVRDEEVGRDAGNLSSMENYDE